jgi:hypothetical protein
LRVRLVYTSGGASRRRTKRTRSQLKQLLKLRNRGADGRGFAANPLGEAPAETVAQIPDFYPYFYAAAFSSLCAFA